MKNIIKIAVIFFAVGQLTAQDLNSYYSYLLNWYNINPAYTGQTDGIKTLLNPATQWVGLDGSPTNSMFGIHSSIRENMGLGGKVTIDKRGVFTNFSAEIGYSYKLNLNDDHKLNFGVTAGLFQTYINANTIIDDRYTDETDPVSTTEYFNQSHFISSFGALYQFKGLELGVSSPHLVLSGQRVSDHIFGTARYRFELEAQKIALIPSVVYQNLTNSPNQLDGGLMVEWNKTIWGQYTYRTNNTMVLATGLNFNSVEFGYAYVLNRSALSTISNGSHEVLIAFTFDKKDKSKKRSTSQISVQGNTNVNSRLSVILTDLKSIKTSSSASEETKKELNSIQNELSKLIDKAKTDKLSDADEKHIVDLENRISQIKSELNK